MLESWFSRFPSDSGRDLRARFRSDDDRAHEGAFFELLLHELLLRLGFQPARDSSHGRPARHPDFRVFDSDGHAFVECTVVRPRSGLFESAPLEQVVLQAIDELDSPDFFLYVQTSGTLASAPSLRQAVRPFVHLMADHDPDKVSDTIERLGFDCSPTARFTHGNWSVDARLMPKSATARGDASTRAIGAGPSRGGVVDSATPLRKAIHDKAGAYHGLDAPLVIAVNAMDATDREDEVAALFGQEQVTYNISDPGALAHLSRDQKGAWVNPSGKPRHTTVAAVVMFRSAAPWRLHGAPVCVYENPFSKIGLPSALLRLPHARVTSGEMEWFAGEDLGNILAIPPDYLARRVSFQQSYSRPRS